MVPPITQSWEMRSMISSYIHVVTACMTMNQVLSEKPDTITVQSVPGNQQSVDGLMRYMVESSSQSSPTLKVGQQGGWEDGSRMDSSPGDE